MKNLILRVLCMPKHKGLCLLEQALQMFDLLT